MDWQATSMDWQSTSVVVTIACLVGGIGLLMFNAFLELKWAGPPPRHPYIKAIFRELAAALVVGGILLGGVHLVVAREEHRLLLELQGRAFLNSIMESPVAEIVEDHLVHEPIVYKNMIVKVKFQGDDKHPGCLSGTSNLRMTIKNRFATVQPFPIKPNFSENRKDCQNTRIVSLIVRRDGSEPLVLNEGALLATENRTSDGVSYRLADLAQKIPDMAPHEEIEIEMVSELGAGMDDRFLQQVSRQTIGLQVDLDIPADLVQWEPLTQTATESLPVRFWHPLVRTVPSFSQKDGKLRAWPRSTDGYSVEVKAAMFPNTAVELKWMPIKKMNEPAAAPALPSQPTPAPIQPSGPRP